MSRTTRLAAVAAASAAVALTASPALAWTGGSVSASAGPGWSCTNVSLNGSISPAGTFTVTSATFSGCSSPVTPQNLPWSGTITNGGGTAILNGFRIGLTMFGAPCVYGGTLLGTNTAPPVTIYFPAQTINKISGSFLCPASIQTSPLRLGSPGPGV